MRRLLFAALFAACLMLAVFAAESANAESLRETPKMPKASICVRNAHPTPAALSLSSPDEELPEGTEGFGRSSDMAEDGADSGGEELHDELERQIGLLELDPLEEYFEGIGEFTGEDIDSLEELLLSLAENGADGEAPGLFGILCGLVKKELGSCLGAAALLCSAALITVIPGLVSDGQLSPLLSKLLSLTALTVTAGAAASLCGTAKAAIESERGLIESALPVMTALLTALGASASAGIFRPLLLFLSGTVTELIGKLVLPVVLSGAVLAAVDSLTEGKRVSELKKLSESAVKWMLGLISTFYLGMTSLQGLTVAVRDGISIRTAKYAVDRLVPIAGGLIGGSVDTVMGCALLVKNGAGTLTLIILLSLLLKPLTVLGAGIFIFRAAAAVCQPVADPDVIRLYTGTAGAIAQLFACVAVTGLMLTVTLLVFIAAGGISAGLW